MIQHYTRQPQAVCYTREGAAALPYTEDLCHKKSHGIRKRICLIHQTHHRTNVATRCAVECGAGGPLAGLVSYQVLKASSHSAATRAGTVHDGQFRHRKQDPTHRHRGWSPHSSSERYRLAQPKREVVGICVTTGDLGTHGMHPPRKRSPHLQRVTHYRYKSNRYVFLCGRTQRSAPTRRICFNKRHHHSRTDQKTVVSQHPATSARTGCIHRASGHALIDNTAHTRTSQSRRARTGAFACPHNSTVTTPRYGDGGYKHR